MKNADYRPIDSTKAALFVMLALVLMGLAIYFVYIPDIRSLKVAHMANERADIALQQARADFQMKQAQHQETREKNARALQVLETPLDSDRLHRDAITHFARFESTPIRQGALDRFEMREYNVTAELREPTDFYEFVDFLNGYQNAVELEFPIRVKADDRFLLDWQFGLKVYHTKPDQSQP